MNIPAPTEIYPINLYSCQVTNVSALNDNTVQVELEVELETPIDTEPYYQAGQYLQLTLDLNKDGQLQPFFYSIANSFTAKKPRQIHIFIQNNSELASKIIQYLREVQHNNRIININLPMGQSFLQTDLNLSHVFIAAGSGISKIKCLTEEILKQKPNVNLHIYWSNKTPNDFYLLDQFEYWANKNKNLNFTPIVEKPTAGWSGRTGYIYEVVQQDFNNLNKIQAYLCGSPKMVYGTIDQLQYQGLKEKNCYSDVFEYAPRHNQRDRNNPARKMANLAI